MIRKGHYSQYLLLSFVSDDGREANTSWFCRRCQTIGVLADDLGVAPDCVELGIFLSAIDDHESREHP